MILIYRFKPFLKILGPLLLLFFLVYLVDINTTAKILKDTNLLIVIFSMAFFPIIIFIRGLRWWIACKNLGIQLSIKRAIEITYTSWFLSLFPVAGASAVAKTFYVREETDSYSTALLSITIDKIFDVLGLFLFAVIGLACFPYELSSATNWEHIYIPFFMVLAILAFIFALRKRIWNGLKHISVRTAKKKVYNLSLSIEKSLEVFRQNFTIRDFFSIFLIEIALGLLRSLVLYLLACSLSINAGFFLMIGCRAFIGIINMIPITLEGLGTRDAVIIFVFSLAGLTKEMAVSLSILAFFWAVCFKLSGVFFWLKHPLPYNTLKPAKNKKPEKSQ